MTVKEKLARFEKWKQAKIDEDLKHREIDRHCDNCKFGDRIVVGCIPGEYGSAFTYTVKCSKLNKIIGEQDCFEAPVNCSDFKFAR
jgi:hypothetical protein